MERIRVRRVRGDGMYKGLWAAYHGKAFLAFAYSKSLDSLMNRVCAKLKTRAEKIEAGKQRRAKRGKKP